MLKWRLALTSNLQWTSLSWKHLSHVQCGTGCLCQCIISGAPNVCVDRILVSVMSFAALFVFGLVSCSRQQMQVADTTNNARTGTTACSDSSLRSCVKLSNLNLDNIKRRHFVVVANEREEKCAIAQTARSLL